jgi:hypothetical protein
MSLDPELLAAWRRWKKLPRPTENYRFRRSRSPTYDVEHQLELLGDTVSGLMRELMSSHSEWDFTTLTLRALRDLERAQRALAELGMPEPIADPLNTYCNASEAVLRGILKEAGGWSSRSA